MRSWFNVLGLFLCVLFLVAVWFIYFANDETQGAVIEGGFGIWGSLPGWSNCSWLRGCCGA